MPTRKSLALFRALANETRLEIVRLLARSGAPGLRSGDIARALGISPATTSHHLFILCKTNVVESRHDETAKSFAIRNGEVERMFAAAQSLFDPADGICVASRPPET